jgi:hypothetical protein
MIDRRLTAFRVQHNPFNEFFCGNDGLAYGLSHMFTTTTEAVADAFVNTLVRSITRTSNLHNKRKVIMFTTRECESILGKHPVVSAGWDIAFTLPQTHNKSASETIIDITSKVTKGDMYPALLIVETLYNVAGDDRETLGKTLRTLREFCLNNNHTLVVTQPMSKEGRVVLACKDASLDDLVCKGYYRNGHLLDTQVDISVLVERTGDELFFAKEKQRGKFLTSGNIERCSMPVL